MTVAAILSEKGRDVVTVSGSNTLADICSKLAERRIGAVVIVDDSKHVLGILSERDIVRVVAASGAAALQSAASDAMTRQVVTCSSEDTIATLMTKMTQGKFRHLPVVENGKLVGIVSIGDVVKRRIAEAEFEARAMRDYIATG